MSSSTPTIDIYDCPVRNPDGSVPITYMIAVMTAAAEGKLVQAKQATGGWYILTSSAWDWSTRSYRIDPAARPAPTMRKIPLTPNDLTGGAIWMRWNKDERSAHFLVVWIGQEGVTTCLDHIRSFEWLSETGAEWSTDRQDWRPFWKEVRA